MLMRANPTRTGQVVLCILIFLFCASAQVPPGSVDRSRLRQQPIINESTLTTVPELFWQMERSAVARLAESHLQAAVSRQTESGIVISQAPAPGTQVKIGTTVSITIGQPQLVLTASVPAVKINQNVEFTATLEPPLPTTLTTARTFVPPRPQYTFNWDDNTQTGPTDSNTSPHSYGIARAYNVSAKVQVGNFSLASDAVTVTVENPVQPPTYHVSLRVDPRSIETGGQVVASATVSPAPPPQTSYLFLWGDRTQDSSQPATATHTYGPPPRRHAVQVLVNINGTEIRSNPVVVEVRALSPPPVKEPPPPVRWPTWEIVVAIVIGILIITGAYKLIRSKKQPAAAQPPHLPESLSVVAKTGSVHHEIQQPEKIRSRPTVRIRSGCTVQSSLQPTQGIARKRSAFNA